jgi:hypothetical protein
VISHSLFLFANLLFSFSTELTVVKRSVLTAKFHQHIVISHFLDITVPHIKDDIHITDGGKSVRNGKTAKMIWFLLKYML